jgi:hypothetical protein
VSGHDGVAAKSGGLVAFGGDLYTLRRVRIKDTVVICEDVGVDLNRTRGIPSQVEYSIVSPKLCNDS